MSKKKSERGLVELTYDTAMNGFFGGLQTGVGACITATTLGLRSNTLERGLKKCKESVKGGNEMGKKIGEMFDS